MNPLPQLLLNHFDDPYHRGACDHPSHAAEQTHSSTACQLRIELQMNEEDIVTEAWFDGTGCDCCESLTSALLERAEGETANRLREWTLRSLLSLLELDTEHAFAQCAELPLATLQQALDSPIDSLDDDVADGRGFGGPSLREEC